MAVPPQKTTPVLGPISKTRRRENRSSDYEEAARSVSFDQDMLAALELEEKLELGAGSTSPKQTLARMLSIKSVVSTSSSFASRMQAAQAAGVAGLHRVIGAGSCGTVFEKVGTVQAVKLSKSGYHDQLWNDYKFHTRVLEGFKGIPIHLQIPKAFWYVEPTTGEEWWNQERSCFDPKFTSSEPPHVLCTERILPLPRAIRDAIVDLWCPNKLKDSAKLEPANNDCLARVYLGARRRERTRPLSMFSLRNFNLTVDLIEELDEVKEYEGIAASMGEALAVMHWRVGTDAQDVEFVLGSAPFPLEGTPMSSDELVKLDTPKSTWLDVTKSNLKRRAIHLWMLDFNQCRNITPDDDGVAIAVQAFYRNDPYFPRPVTENATEKRLWECFEKAYLKLGAKVIMESNKAQKPWRGSVDQELPKKFIESCIGEANKRDKVKAEAQKRLHEDKY